RVRRRTNSSTLEPEVEPIEEAEAESKLENEDADAADAEESGLEAEQPEAGNGQAGAAGTAFEVVMDEPQLEPSQADKVKLRLQQRGAERRAEMARQREEKRRSDVAEREAAERRRAEERQKRCQELAKSRAAATRKQQQLQPRRRIDTASTSSTVTPAANEDESKPTGRQRPLSLIQASPQQPPPSPSPRRPAVFSSGRKLSASSARRSVSAAHLADSSEQQQQPQQPSVRLFVQPTEKSNRAVIHNAISHCCLAGPVNAPAKTAVIAELAASQSLHFMLLFRDAKCHYLGLYSYDQEGDRLLSLAGRGPAEIRHDMVASFYKYNSGGKRFTEIRSTSHLSPAIDAVVLQDRVSLTLSDRRFMRSLN
uniref:CKK domain-containing protein n=1 Tax=Macrostomum lignano TaxID=282301 RepID=A0A1I8J3K2_9PLAT